MIRILLHLHAKTVIISNLGIKITHSKPDIRDTDLDLRASVDLFDFQTTALEFLRDEECQENKHCT